MLGMDQEDEDKVQPFSRSDIYYNRDVEPLAKHFDVEKNERQASIQAMNMYRKSVSGMCSDDDFGRRLSILSCSTFVPKSTEEKLPIAAPTKITAFKVLPCQTLLTNPKFHLFMLHGFFHFTALYMPFQFLPSQMLSVGLSKKVAGRVVSTMAFAGLIGRLICGFLMDHPKIGAVKAYTASQFIVALAIMCLQFCTFEE